MREKALSADTGHLCCSKNGLNFAFQDLLVSIFLKTGEFGTYDAVNFTGRIKHYFDLDFERHASRGWPAIDDKLTVNPEE